MALGVGGWKGGRAGWGWGFVTWHVCRSQDPFLVVDWGTKVFLGYYGLLWEVYDYANYVSGLGATGGAAFLWSGKI